MWSIYYCSRSRTLHGLILASWYNLQGQMGLQPEIWNLNINFSNGFLHYSMEKQPTSALIFSIWKSTSLISLLGLFFFQLLPKAVARSLSAATDLWKTAKKSPLPKNITKNVYLLSYPSPLFAWMSLTASGTWCVHSFSIVWLSMVMLWWRMESMMMAPLNCGYPPASRTLAIKKSWTKTRLPWLPTSSRSKATSIIEYLGEHSPWLNALANSSMAEMPVCLYTRRYNRYPKLLWYSGLNFGYFLFWHKYCC